MLPTCQIMLDTYSTSRNCSFSLLISKHPCLIQLLYVFGPILEVLTCVVQNSGIDQVEQVGQNDIFAGIVRVSPGCTPAWIQTDSG